MGRKGVTETLQGTAGLSLMYPRTRCQPAGYVAKIAAKVKVQLDSGNLVDLYKTSVKLNVADVEAAQVGARLS